MPLVDYEIKKKFVESALKLLPKYITSKEKETIQKLGELHLKHHKLRLQYRKEYIELANKYINLFEKNYEERRRYIADNNTAVPNFWLNVMKHHSVLNNSIEPWDQPVLKYLIDIQSHYLDPNEHKSFVVTFIFHPDNPYFTNQVLKKKFIMQDDSETGETLFVQSIGTEIHWKENKNVTISSVNKKQRSKISKEIRTVTIKKNRSSFFNFFHTRMFPNEQDLQVMSSSEIQNLENYFSVEYEIGQLLRDRIIPLATGWYLDIEIDSEEENSLDEEEYRETSHKEKDKNTDSD